MRCGDLDVLAKAHRSEFEYHEHYRDWLEASRYGDKPLGLASAALSGFVRVVTHPRVFREPTPREQALEFVEALRASPTYLAVEPGERHWGIFVRLCRDGDARGNLVPDAYLAALAIERGATWYSTDRGFRRYPDLR